MMTFLALAHMYATQLMGWVVDDDFPDELPSYT